MLARPTLASSGTGLLIVLISSLLLLVLAGCTSSREISSLRQDQEAHLRLLEQQSRRLQMQEEVLSLLTDSQRELNRSQRDLVRMQRELAMSQEALAATLSGLEERTRQIQGALSLSMENDEREEGEEEEEDASNDLDAALEAAEKVVLGRVEWVWLELLQRNLKARVDTGALSSSLSAFDVQPFERDGREWVRFRVPADGHPEGGTLHEAPLSRHVRIRQASSEELDRRPVISLTIKMGDVVEDVEFNLTDRRDMLYPVLLGRNFLRDIALVDAADKFTRDKQPEPPAVEDEVEDEGEDEDEPEETEPEEDDDEAEVGQDAQ